MLEGKNEREGHLENQVDAHVVGPSKKGLKYRENYLKYKQRKAMKKKLENANKKITNDDINSLSESLEENCTSVASPRKVYLSLVF